MNVMGCDPGLKSAGLALISVTGMHRELVLLETITQGADVPTNDRKAFIGRRVRELIETYGVHLICIEDQRGVFFAQQKAGATNFKSREVQGVVDHVLGLASALSVQAMVIEPRSVRALMGVSVGATKGAVAIAAARQCPGTWKGSSHAKDAAAIAIAGERKWSADRRVSGARRVGGGQK